MEEDFSHRDVLGEQRPVDGGVQCTFCNGDHPYYECDADAPEGFVEVGDFFSPEHSGEQKNSTLCFPVNSDTRAADEIVKKEPPPSSSAPFRTLQQLEDTDVSKTGDSQTLTTSPSDGLLKDGSLSKV